MLIALGWAGVLASELGTQGALAHEAKGEIDAWPTGANRPPAESVASLRSRLMGVTDPAEPVLNELVGITELRLSVDSRGDLENAREHFGKSLAVRPTSPYTWANLAEAMYRMGDTGTQFSAAIGQAARMGPYEPEVQRAVANYGLATWDELSPEVQARVDRMIATGMRRNSLEMLRIAERRGRLAIACRHLAGAERQTQPKSIQLCQSVEATP